MSYKYCFVPQCKSSTSSTPEKIFISVPQNKAERKKWINAVRRDLKKEPLSEGSQFFVCEDHFDLENDVENLLYVKLFRSQGKHVKVKLKPGTLPTKFDCQVDRFVTEKRTKCSEHREALAKKRTCLERQYLVEDILSSLPVDSSSCSRVPEEETILFQDDLSLSTRRDIGIQVEPDKCDKAVQFHFHYRSHGTQTKPFKTISTVTSPIKFPPMPPVSRDVQVVSPEEDPASSDPDFIAHSVSSLSFTSTIASAAEQTHKDLCLEVAMKNVEWNPKLFLGISKECYFTVKLLEKATGFSARDILVTLKKLRCNHQFSIIASDFGMSEMNVSRIFQKTLPLIARELRKIVYWPTRDVIHLNLPIPFRKKFKSVVSIIDCFEIQIEKPTNPYHQALTWSQYYNCNTFKYLISCTPNGFVSFISTGYGGRISDIETVTASGYLNFLSNGDHVMAGRGFKHLSPTLSKLNVTLVRLPSVSSGKQLTKQEVRTSKEIASLRVHVERVIGRFREFKLITPHATVDNKLICSLDLAVQCIAGLINIQSVI